MSVKLGIMGFGRLGRNMFRIGHNQPDVTFAAVSDIADVETLAYLLQSSTVEGEFEGDLRQKGHYLMTERQCTRVVHGSRPGDVPWDVLGVDIVIEATGVFRKRRELQKHLDAGAKAVILSTPPQDSIDRMIINGVNDHELKAEDRIISCGSSSCHALAVVMKVLQEKVGVKRATMTTVHAYTSDQQLSDSARGDLRWSRSAAQNIIPNTSWAPGAVMELMPELAGKIDGMALNVPVSAGSNIDLVVELEKPLSAEDYNALMRDAAQGRYNGLICYTDEPIVSSDVIGNSCSAVVDAQATMSLGNGLVKSVLWYDNGWAYAYRMLETARRLAGLIRSGEVLS
ncbi:MAG TPA: glyceraldehyde 3-phosphate dehydrogenase NAD-binding domain-containing protein [Candidatus Krumholzibacteria bacterium]|nr:glyceraldehyde 3-phosphate dehydrogenase NAD-binding domain-containing protein [Candidatus Krumholzibacteria bacterium]